MFYNLVEVFENGYHGYGIVLEGSHSSEEHETKEDIDRCPESLCVCDYVSSS